MTIRNEAISAFPSVLNPNSHIYDLAMVLWPDIEAEKLSEVRDWQELLDMDVSSLGLNGIGPLMLFMDGEMALHYLPAWLVLSCELPFPSAGVLPAIVSVLDDNAQDNDEERERFKILEKTLNRTQKDFIRHALEAMAELHFKNNRRLRDRLFRVAEYWRLAE